MLIVPTLKVKPEYPLYAKQAECMEKQYGKEFFAELMDPGTGKTAIAIVEAANLFLEGKLDFVFIIAPSGVEIQWAVEEIPKHCPVDFDTFVWEDLNTQKEQRRFKQFYQANGKLKFLCVRVDSFSRTTYITFFKNVILGKKTYLVVDEASRIKNPEAERTFNLLYLINRAMNINNEEIDLHGANQKGQKGKLTKIEDFDMSAKYRRILTGSLVTTSPFNVWAPFNFLKYNFFGTSYEGFRARHGIETRELGRFDKEFYRLIRRDEMERVLKLHTLKNSVEQISQEMKISETSVNWIIAHPDSKSPYKRLEELKISIEPYSFTCPLSDVIDIDVVTETTYVEMTAEQKRIYKEVEDDMIANYGDEKLTVVSKLALITKLSQITSGFFPADDIVVNEEGEELKEVKLIPIGKTNAKIESLKAELWEHSFDTPSLVFARFTSDIDLLYVELKKEFPLLTIEKYYGPTPNIERNAIKARFIEGQIDLLICNPSLAGIGLNLQRANRTFHYSFDYSYEKRKQANGRTIRSGQKSNTVLIKNTVCRKTIDERVLAVLTDRQTLAEYFAEKSIREFLGR